MRAVETLKTAKIAIGEAKLHSLRHLCGKLSERESSKGADWGRGGLNAALRLEAFGNATRIDNITRPGRWWSD